ncbi:MAG: hypothetical protein QM758_27385 [Armatimonas sp.]
MSCTPRQITMPGSQLYARQQSRWQRYANRHFLKGIETLCLNPDRVPRLADVNQFLSPRTGFSAKAVSGYVPAFQFFDCLRQRAFPTTITIRDAERLDYLPEPDIFHDIAGHVPMHTDPAFADALVRFGDCAHTAAEIVAGIADEAEQTRKFGSIIKAMARFFWFTMEFGLMREELTQSLWKRPTQFLRRDEALRLILQRFSDYPIQLEWVINQYFEIDHYQPLLFVVDSFEHLFELVGTLEEWMKDGKLDHVAPGEPYVSETDLRSFLDHANR